MELYIVFIIYSVAVSCYKIEKLEDVNGGVWQFGFDQYSNTYLTTNYNGSTFYKIDSRNNVVVTETLSGSELPHFVINKLGDVYLFEGSGLINLRYLKANTNKFELIYRYRYEPKEGCFTPGFLSFADEEDIIYVNSVNGVFFFRSRENIFLEVDNLEGFNYCDQVVDGDGNVYLSLNNDRRVVVIPKESKRLPVLRAETIIGSKDQVKKYLMPGYQNYAFAAWYTSPGTMTVELLSKNSTELLFERYYTIVGVQFFAKDAFLLTAYGILENGYYAFILTPDKKIRKMESPLFNILIGGYKYPSVTNSEGLIVFDTPRPVNEETAIAIVNPNQLKLDTIAVPGRSTVDSLLVDIDDNTWIMSNGLYVLTNGSSNVIRVSGLPLTAFDVKYEHNYKHMLQKPATKEIYIGAMDGLYICAD